MGCAASKLDDSPAVALCRHRCSSLDEALRLRFSFADSHAAYLSSLHSLGLSLHRFFLHDSNSLSASSATLLNLPPSKRGESKIERDSSSDSGSHLQFDSDSDEESAPLRNLGANFGGGGGGFVNLNYMRNETTPSVAHTLLPISSETVQMNHSDRNSGGYSNLNGGGAGFCGDFSSPSDEESAPLQNRDVDFGGGGFLNVNYMRNRTTPSVAHTQLPNGAETVHMNYGDRISDGYSNYGGGGGFYGDFSSPSASKEAPPSPPRSSTWDFLNPFETVEKFYPAYDSSHDSREVREEEGIPDLEEADDDDDGKAGEVLKKGGNGDDHHKLADVGRNSYSKSKSQENDFDSKPNATKKSEESSRNGGFKDDLDVLREIQIQFEKASQCGNDLAKFLEVGKLPYKQKQGNFF